MRFWSIYIQEENLYMIKPPDLLPFVFCLTLPSVTGGYSASYSSWLSWFYPHGSQFSIDWSLGPAVGQFIGLPGPFVAWALDSSGREAVLNGVSSGELPRHARFDWKPSAGSLLARSWICVVDWHISDVLSPITFFAPGNCNSRLYVPYYKLYMMVFSSLLTACTHYLYRQSLHNSRISDAIYNAWLYAHISDTWSID